MKTLRRIRIPSLDPERDMLAVRHIFYGHVLSANSPELRLERADGGFVMDLDVRTYDNYWVDRALEEVRRRFPAAQDEARGSGQ